MVLCEVCNTSYNGNRKECPKCADENKDLKAELKSKQVQLDNLAKDKQAEIDSLNKSMAEEKSSAQAMTDLAKAMQTMMTGMAGVMTQLTELKAGLPDREIVQDRGGAGDRGQHRQDGVHRCCCGGKHDRQDGRQDGRHDGRQSTPAPRQHLPRVVEDLEDLWEDRDEFEYVRRVEKRKSRFDILKFLPVQDRKKTHPVDTSEKLMVLLSQLIDELHDDGECTKGFRAHQIYVGTMADQGIYDIRALVSYDQAIRDKADKYGMDCVVGVDTALSNFHLGYAGTKQARGLSSKGDGQVSSKGKYKSKSRGDRQDTFAGWKKVAAEKRCCFAFGAARPCDGCAYKHECGYCGSGQHGMLACKSKDASGGASA